MMSLPHLFGRGRGQRDAGRRAESLADLAELQVFGPKIVPPLAHAVGFIHRKEPRLEDVEHFLKVRRVKPLGRDVQQSVKPLPQFIHHLPA